MKLIHLILITATESTHLLNTKKKVLLKAKICSLECITCIINYLFLSFSLSDFIFLLIMFIESR